MTAVQLFSELTMGAGSFEGRTKNSDNYGGKLYCLICGKLAKGIFSRVISCSGCKAFYQRSLKKQTKYVCRSGGQCETLNNGNVRSCRACRFKKYQTWHAACKTGSATKSNLYSGTCIAQTDTFVPAITNWDQDGNADSSTDSSLVPTYQFWMDGTPKDSSILYHGPGDLVEYHRHAPMENIYHGQISSFLDDHQSNELSRQQKINSTLYFVELAVHKAFGDQLTQWTTYMDRALSSGDFVNQPEAHIDDMRKAIDQHTIDIIYRIQKFADLLPGMTDLDPVSRGVTAFAWKALVCSVIHHAPFRTSYDSFFTIGPRKLRMCKYWEQEPRFGIRSFQDMTNRFSAYIRGIGLDQRERYLLMAVVLLEPGQIGSETIGHDILHSHYTEALLRAVEERCCSHAERMSVCRKLEGLLDMLKSVTGNFVRYFPRYDVNPPCYSGAAKLVIQLEKDKLGDLSMY